MEKIMKKILELNKKTKLTTFKKLRFGEFFVFVFKSDRGDTVVGDLCLKMSLKGQYCIFFQQGDTISRNLDNYEFENLLNYPVYRLKCDLTYFLPEVISLKKKLSYFFKKEIEE